MASRLKTATVISTLLTTLVESPEILVFPCTGAW
jgi:hypothetical protein